MKGNCGVLVAEFPRRIVYPGLNFGDRLLDEFYGPLPVPGRSRWGHTAAPPVRYFNGADWDELGAGMIRGDRPGVIPPAARACWQDIGEDI